MTTTQAPTRITVTLRDGTGHTFTVDRMPRHWKSWATRQLPYGSDVQGAEFTITR